MENAMSRTSSELNSIGDAKIYRAGAGAGKTTRLVAEVYDFYKEFRATSDRDPKIVLTTFTRKATQELKERLMMKAQENKDYDFLNFILSKNNLLISTIHGVLQVFLRQYAQVIDLDPGFQIVERSLLFHEAKILLKDLIKTEERYSFLLEEFTFKQLTSIMMRHSDNLLKKPKSRPLGMQDFKLAQQQLHEQFAKELDYCIRNIELEDQQGKWKDFVAHLQATQNYLSSKDYTELSSFIQSVSKPRKNPKNPVVSEQLDAQSKEIVDTLKEFDFSLMSEEKTESFLQIFDSFDSLSQVFHKSFLNLKKQKGYLDLSDLESMTLEILNKDLSRYSSFSKNYDYWLIDEFQDTSPVQVEILEKIKSTQKFFVVGDPQQSIYFFRGARVRVFDEMQKKIVESGGQLIPLDTNYRSQPEVMSFINYFFMNYEQPFTPMKLGRTQGKKVSLQIGLFADEDEQSNQIAQHILNLSKHTPLGDICVIARKNDQLKTIADTLKKNKIPYYLHSAQGFSSRREILDLKSFLKFLVNPHDNFNLISLLRSPWFPVEEDFIVQVTSQKPKNSFWSEFVKYEEQPEYKSIKDLRQSYIRALKCGVSQVLQDFLIEHRVLETSLLLDPTGRREANIWKFVVQLREEDHASGFNYLKFIDEGSSDISTEEGMDNSDGVSALEPNQVQLMTVHSSKGLEFEHVILPDLNKKPNIGRTENYFFHEESGMWGLKLRLGEQDLITPLPMRHMYEERAQEETQENHRLLYVAMTRAKSGLFMSTSGKAESASWLRSMRLPLEFQTYNHPEFAYEVIQDVPVHVSEMNLAKEDKTEIVPLAMSSSGKERDVASVTSQLKWLHQGVDHVVPLMKSALEGQRLHKIFESLKYTDLSQVLSGMEVKDKQAIEWLWAQTQIPFSDILKNGYAEWGFVLKTSEGSLSGQIDLWGHVNDQIWILDYKTGKSTYHEKALLQLKTYAQALAEYMPGKPISLAAIYPFEQIIKIQQFEI